MAGGLVTVWTDWGRRASVASGTLVALVSMVADCPVWVAALRGVATLVGLGLLVGLCARVIAWSAAGDRQEALARTAAEGALAAQRERR